MTAQNFTNYSTLLERNIVSEQYQGWVALLSDGSFALEQVYTGVHGELSSWQQLIDRLQTQNLRIEQMWLRRGAFIVATVQGAEGYVQAYQQTAALNSNRAESYQGIGSVHGDAVVMQWIGKTGQVFQDIKPLNEMLVHTTLRQPNDLYRRA